MRIKRISAGLALGLILTILMSLPSVSAAEEGIVNLNKASVKEMLEIEDIDIPEEIAKAIVEFRTKNGPFKDPTDLRKVPGMTDDMYEEINPVLDEDGNVVYDPDAEPTLAPSKC